VLSLFEPTRVGRRLQEIVDADNLDSIAMALQHRPQRLTPEFAKPVDTYAILRYVTSPYMRDAIAWSR
jgi:hypothetical protein